MALATSRPIDPPAYFQSWVEYLRHWTSSEEATFCQTVAAVYQPALVEELTRLTTYITRASTLAGSDDERAQLRLEFEAEHERLKTRLAFPWVTPILGSGCLSLAESGSASSIEAVPRVVAHVSREWGALPDGTAASSAIEQFALSLVNSKLGTAAADRARHLGLSTEAVAELTTDTTDVAARVILCARLLTRLYFEAGSTTEGAVLSYQDSISFSTVLGGPSPRGSELYDVIVRPLIDQLEVLGTAAPTRDRQLAFVADFAGAVLKDLTAERNTVTVTGSDAILMAEIAWHFMTEGTSQYPGWSDLLTQLTLVSDSAERSHRWPHLQNLTLARARLRSQIITTTVDSWESRVNAGSSTDATSASTKPAEQPATSSMRDNLYDAVAELLVSQASLHNEARSEGAEQWPPAVAFVTSFDLELEMALMAARSAFRLVVPFYIAPVDKPDHAQAFVWLQTIVDAVPDGALSSENLFSLRVTRGWTLLTSLPDPTSDDFSLPIVVRVAGSPLIKIDGIDALSDDEQPFAAGPQANSRWIDALRASLGGPAMTVVGTVLLDEHTALHQWAAELARPPMANKDNQDERLGLPVRLFKGGQDMDARFWFVLGVQLGDEAVRQRTAAVVSTADLRSHSQTEPRATRRAGVVVNRRTAPNERDVFLWQGLDVVAATYEQVVPALRHMAEHAANPVWRRLPGARCDVPGGPA